MPELWKPGSGRVEEKAVGCVCVCEPSLTGLKMGGCGSRPQKDMWGGEKEVYGQDQREAPLVVLVGDRCHLQIEL